MIRVEDGRGRLTGTVRHLPKHSPAGLNWGYAGAGSADTARSLLIAALGEAAVCAVCRRSGRVVYVRGSTGEVTPEPYDPVRHPWSKNGWQCPSDGGYRRLPYPAFVGRFVTRWGEEWVIARSQLPGTERAGRSPLGRLRVCPPARPDVYFRPTRTPCLAAPCPQHRQSSRTGGPRLLTCGPGELRRRTPVSTGEEIQRRRRPRRR